jgi:hypothetical protein
MAKHTTTATRADHGYTVIAVQTEIRIFRIRTLANWTNHLTLTPSIKKLGLMQISEENSENMVADFTRAPIFGLSRLRLRNFFKVT